VGLYEEDMSKPQVGISSVWHERNTCNMNLLQLAEAVKEGVTEAGMRPSRRVLQKQAWWAFFSTLWV
jgi:dihydroxyacid dehydratase/phosphogluconate dehydratase